MARPQLGSTAALKASLSPVKRPGTSMEGMNQHRGGGGGGPPRGSTPSPQVEQLRAGSRFARPKAPSRENEGSLDIPAQQARGGAMSRGSMFSRGSSYPGGGGMSQWQDAPGEGQGRAAMGGASRGGFRSRASNGTNPASRATTSNPGARGISFAPSSSHGEARFDDHFEGVINGTRGMLQLSAKMGRTGARGSGGSNPLGQRQLGLAAPRR